MEGLILRFATPEWFYKFSQMVYLPYFSENLKRTYQAFDDLKHHILELVSTARAWASGDRTKVLDAALVRNLVEANMDQGGNSKSLTDNELLSNAFVSTCFLCLTLSEITMPIRRYFF